MGIICVRVHLQLTATRDKGDCDAFILQPVSVCECVCVSGCECVSV